MYPNPPVKRIDPMGPQTMASHLGQVVNPVGTWTVAQVAQDSWSTPWDLGPRPESPGTTGRHHRPSFTGPRLPGQLDDTVGTWSTLRALGHGPESPRTAGRPRGPSEPGPCRQGHLVDPAGTQTLALVARDSCSTPRAIGPNRESPGRAGRPRRHSDPGPSRPEELVKPVGPWTRAQVTQ